MTAKNKLWVYDTINHLEIYAETREDAEKEVYKHEKDTGMDFVLVHDWEIYQKEHEEQCELELVHGLKWSAKDYGKAFKDS